MIEGTKRMKYLKVEENKAYFCRLNAENAAEWVQIDLIGKDDLQALLNNAIADEFEMDPYSEETLSNKAHYIIYKNLHEKFTALLANKSRFKDESDSLYKTALEKYSIPAI